MSPLLAEQVVGEVERSFRREAEQAFRPEHHRSVATVGPLLVWSQSCQSIWLLMFRLFRGRNRDGDRPFVVAHKKCNQFSGFGLAGVRRHPMNSIGGFIEGFSNLVDTLRLVIDLAADI